MRKEQKERGSAASLSVFTEMKARWAEFRNKQKTSSEDVDSSAGDGNRRQRPAKWSLGVLNDKETEEVPGSVLLLSRSTRQQPLGLHLQPARTSASSLPIPYRTSSLRSQSAGPESRAQTLTETKKKTSDGQIILEPQPDDSLNDPLNWPVWRRNTALLSLGWHCLVGGGMTPILAAGFKQVAKTYNVTIPQVALTTGLYMMGLGLGSVISSPTAILYGKRPVYLLGTLLFLASAVWCSESPTYITLVIARIVMGFGVSPCESLPSATIAEIFFLHERAYRVGIYTLLLLGGKNLVPLVSAAIIQAKGWRWVFRIVAIIVAFDLVLLFFFVPETFWDRTPRPKKRPNLESRRTLSSLFLNRPPQISTLGVELLGGKVDGETETTGGRVLKKRQVGHAHVEWAENTKTTSALEQPTTEGQISSTSHGAGDGKSLEYPKVDDSKELFRNDIEKQTPLESYSSKPGDGGSPDAEAKETLADLVKKSDQSDADAGIRTPGTDGDNSSIPPRFPYTDYLTNLPPLTFLQTLKPWNGRLRNDSWFRATFRPFILFAYPAVLWSALVYSLAVGWLIVLSETVASVYQHNPYNFTPLGTGLVYVSPFVGGILGTVVAGKVSDVIVRYMTRQNGGVYEPEFRLVMAIPVAVTTSIGLMGFGWSANIGDKWIVPTVFFGVISFGCSLGSTTAITFCVDSYRQYAGEALVTLNFSKNIFHGLVFSLFLNRWLEADGTKRVFLTLGGIQLACLAFTVPLYIFGKRARMWTVRMNFMEKF